MIYIDPDLHNPKINGVPLLVDNRINPSIAISKDDLVASDGIFIEKFDDGTIQISADVNTSQGESKYTTIQSIDFMSNLPSVLFKYLNALFDGIGTKLYYVRDYSLDKKRDEIKPSVLYEFDSSGNPGIINEDIPSGNVIVSASVKDSDYEDGQGVLFNITKEQDCIYNITIATDSEFESVVLASSTGKNTCFVSLDNFQSGTYYWRVRSINKNNFVKSEYTSGSFNFVWQEPKKVKSGDGTSIANAIYYNNVNGTGSITCSREYGTGSVFYMCAFDPEKTYVFSRNSNYDDQLWVLDKNGNVFFSDDDDMYSEYSFSQRTIAYIEINAYARYSDEEWCYGYTNLTISPMPSEIKWNEV